MLAMRSIALVFALFCGKGSTKFLLTFQLKKKAGLWEYFFLKKNAEESQDIRSTRFNARAIIDSENESFTEEPVREYFAQCRHHSSHFVHTL